MYIGEKGVNDMTRTSKIALFAVILCALAGICMAQDALVVESDGRLGPISVHGAITATGAITTNSNLVVQGNSTVTGTIKADHGFGYVPIGSIIAWYCENPSTNPPSGWVKCNGQTISVTRGSYLDNLDTKNNSTFIVPNLNGSKRFLRGGNEAGVEESDSVKNHTHGITVGQAWSGSTQAPPLTSAIDNVHGTTSTSIFNTISGGGGTETRPINMSVIWIIRVE